MSLAENLLNSLDETAYQNMRIAGGVPEEHIKVGQDRVITVPNSLKTIAVKGDKDIETATIDCVRYWDGHDLSTFAIYINYILPNGDEGTYIPESITRSEDVFSFDWEIGSEITYFQGKLTFWIVAKLTDDSGVLIKQWSSFQNSDCTIAHGGDKIYVPEKQTDQDVISQAISISRESAEIAKKEAKSAKESADLAVSYNGKGAYAYAKEGGYDGTEKEFATDINPDNINAKAETFIVSELAKRGQLKPEFANSVAECTDTTKLYVLPDGHIWAYIHKEIPETTVANFTNRLPESIDTDGSVYNGKGFKENTRLETSGATGNRTGIGTTGFIPFGVGSANTARGEQVVYLANVDVALDANTRIAFYKSDKTFIGLEYAQNLKDASADPGGSVALYTKGADGFVNMMDFTGTTSYYKNSGKGETAFFRIGAPNLDGDSIITVNQPITYSTTGGYTTDEWCDTGLTINPVSDALEDRVRNEEALSVYFVSKIEMFDEQIKSLKSEGVPDYIITEAERVAKAVQNTRTAKSLVFPIMSDMHLFAGNSDHDNSLISAQYAGMGVSELKKLMHLDFTAYLGDYSWMDANGNYTVEQVIKDITAFKKTTDTTDKEIWCVGNHDLNYGKTRDRLLTNDELYSNIGANSDGVKHYGSIERGYGYLDFDNQKIRIIYLNTCDVSDWLVTVGETAVSEWISPTQIQWLADTALDFSDKETPSEWGTVIVGHHPLDYPKGCYGYVMTILEAYRDGLSGSLSCQIRKEVDNTNSFQTVNYNFSTEERAEIICNIHGHNHNCGVNQISSTSWKEHNEGVVPVPTWLWRFCIPNICSGRENSGYENFSYNELLAKRFGEFDANGNPVYWRKETGTAKATSFCVVNIDRKNRKIHAHIFGAGIDREISY